MDYFWSKERGVWERGVWERGVWERGIKKDKDMRFFERREEIGCVGKIGEMGKKNGEFRVVRGGGGMGKR